MQLDCLAATTILAVFLAGGAAAATAPRVKPAVRTLEEPLKSTAYERAAGHHSNWHHLSPWRLTRQDTSQDHRR
jgi:hypothetical protein